MKFPGVKNWQTWALLSCGVFPVAATGCQATIGGQTLPSAYYLEDDVQYFPAGPEFLLPNEVRALDEYRLEQSAIQNGINAPIPGPPVPALPPAFVPPGAALPPGGPGAAFPAP